MTSSLCSFVKIYYALEESASSNFKVEELLMFIQPQESQRMFLPNVSNYLLNKKSVIRVNYELHLMEVM